MPLYSQLIQAETGDVIKQMLRCNQVVTDSGTFTGVLLWDLIQEAQVITDPAQKNDLFRKAVLITGSDCYEIVYAMGELAPQLGGTHQVIVAFKRDDLLLGDREGMARIINPGDKAGARRVMNIVRIRVLTAPLTLPITTRAGGSMGSIARQIFACGVVAVVFLSARPARALR